MGDTRNTRKQLEEALSASREAARRRPPAVRALAEALFRDGAAHGFQGPLLAMCDAVLLAAERKLAEAAKLGKDGPKIGDLEAEANHLLGIYEQLHAAYAVAQTR